MNRTKIEWTDFTWNPVTGCIHGCPYCYARKITQRFPKAFPQGFKPTFHPERLDKPKWVRKPSRIFTVSMGDLFGSWVPYEWQEAVFRVVEETPRHTFQFLTKDPLGAGKALLRYFPTIPENLWVGVSVDGTATTKKTAWLPNRVYGGVRFVSFEPLLEDVGDVNLAGIDWIIIGAQTNPTKRPKPEWVEHLVQQARAAGVAVFLKDSIQSWWPEEIREFPEARR